MQILRRAQPLDGRDLRALLHRGEGEAGVDPPTADEDGAGAALTVIATLLLPVK